MRRRDHGGAGTLTARANTALQGTWSGPRLVTWRGVTRMAQADVCESLVRVVSRQGFHVLPARSAGRTIGTLGGRHIALVVGGATDAARAGRILRDLVTSSARGHLVFDVRRSARQVMTGRATSGASSLLALARRALAEGRTDRAEALLATADVECRLRGCRPPAGLVTFRGLLLAWQGRWDEAAAEIRKCRGPHVRLVSAFVAWGRLDLATIGALRIAARRGRKGHAGERVGCEALADSLETGRVAAGGDATRPSSQGVRRPLGTRLVVANALLARGDGPAALQVLGPPCEWGGAGGLARLVAAWLEARARGSPEVLAALTGEIRRTGLSGVRRWGLGRAEMRLLLAIPHLLTIVNEADDDLAALDGAAHWLEQEAGAVLAGFLDDHGGIVAGRPTLAGDLPAADRRRIALASGSTSITRPDDVVVAVPVRYAGTRIGAVVATGPADAEPALCEAAGVVGAMTGPALRAWLDEVRGRAACHERMPELVGRSPSMVALREAVARAARSPFPVLIEGESGSGKELVARAIHRLGARRDRPLAALNCAALTDELAETELFGHVRGAFTGAIGPRVGLFEEAHRGTLFLDELGELSARTQARLLRALQEREVRRLGENRPRSVDVRVLAATNRVLTRLVADGSFREDLYFRLAVVRLRVPPLRDRLEDIALLAATFWRGIVAGGLTRAVLGVDAVGRLARHAWPGNVRELQNVVSALAVAAPSRGRVSARHVELVLADSTRHPAPPVRSLDSARIDCERKTVAAALARHAGRRSAAARELGLSRQGLAKAMRRLRVEDPPGRSVPGAA